MKSFRITDARSKKLIGKVVTINSIEDNKVVLTLGRKQYKVMVNEYRTWDVNLGIYDGEYSGGCNMSLYDINETAFRSQGVVVRGWEKID